MKLSLEQEQLAHDFGIRLTHVVGVDDMFPPEDGIREHVDYPRQTPPSLAAFIGQRAAEPVYAAQLVAAPACEMITYPDLQLV